MEKDGLKIYEPISIKYPLCIEYQHPREKHTDQATNIFYAPKPSTKAPAIIIGFV